MRRIVLIAFLVLTGILVRAQNIYLVAVGIADYPGDREDLSLPANDAKAIYQLYQKHFRAKAILITDERATRQNIVTQTNRLFAQAGKEDIVVFFFSGHGYPGGFAIYNDYLDYGDVRSLFASCKASNKMIFADACFAGGLRENKRDVSHRNQGVMLFLASRENEFSWENSQMRNSFFVSCLLRCLKGGADVNHDRIITAKELFTAVSKGVWELSEGIQHPVMWGNFDDNMPVMRW